MRKVIIFPVAGGEATLRDLVAEYPASGTEYQCNKRRVFRSLTGRRGQDVVVLHWPHDRRRIEIVAGGEWLCTAHPQGALSAAERKEVLAERRRQKAEADRLRRRAARRARYALSPATGAAGPEPTVVLTDRDVDGVAPAASRSVSLLGLATD